MLRIIELDNALCGVLDPCSTGSAAIHKTKTAKVGTAFLASGIETNMSENREPSGNRGGISGIAEPRKAARETISHGWRSPPANWREMMILKLFCIKINKPVKIEQLGWNRHGADVPQNHFLSLFCFVLAANLKGNNISMNWKKKQKVKESLGALL